MRRKDLTSSEDIRHSWISFVAVQTLDYKGSLMALQDLLDFGGCNSTEVVRFGVSYAEMVFMGYNRFARLCMV